MQQIGWAPSGKDAGLIRRFVDCIKSLNYASLLFLGIFALPTVGAVLYYGLIASDRYVSETKFIVRGVSGNQIGGLSVILKTFGISRSNDDTYAIEEYIISRDALRDLQKKVDIAAVYAIGKGDIITAYGPLFGSGNFESTYKYFKNQVTVIRDVETGITSLKVSAFEAADAKLIADELLRLSETRVNEMNERSRADALANARQNLAMAEAQILAAQAAITDFRNKEFTIDLTKSVSGNLEIISGLYKTLADEEVNLQQLQRNSPSSPAIVSQQQKVNAILTQIEAEKAKIGGSDSAIATKLGTYEQLVLRKSLADTAYETAVSSMEQARDEARRKQIYLEPIVRPNLPDASTEPQRIRSIFTVALLSFSSFLMIYLLVSGGREHLNVH